MIKTSTKDQIKALKKEIRELREDLIRAKNGSWHDGRSSAFKEVIDRLTDRGH